MAQKLLLVRHACLSGVPAGGLLGNTDLPISPEGIEQTRRVLPLIRAAKPEVCYCSPLLRARQTADIFLKRLHIPIQIDDELREIDFGRWECKTFEQIASENPQAVKRWASYDQRFAFPGGDLLGEFFARVRRMSRRLSKDSASTILAVTHGGVIRAMICHYLRLRPRNYILFNVSHATCVTIDLFDGRGVLTGLNLTHSPEGS